MTGFHDSASQNSQSPTALQMAKDEEKIVPLSPQSCTVMPVCFALCNVSLRDVSLVWRPPDRSSLDGRFVSDCSLRGFSYSKPSQQLCFWHERALVYRDGEERGFNPAQYSVSLLLTSPVSCEQLRTPRPLPQIFFFVRWAVHNNFKAS